MAIRCNHHGPHHLGKFACAWFWQRLAEPVGGRGGALDALRLPSDWVTNFLVRKTAHFTEYAVLGVLVAHAFDPEHAAEHMRLAAICLALVLVPSIDETIQLFMAGRSGQVTDVLLDCCGAATGVLLTYLVWRLRRRETPAPGDSDSS